MKHIVFDIVKCCNLLIFSNIKEVICQQIMLLDFSWDLTATTQDNAHPNQYAYLYMYKNVNCRPRRMRITSLDTLSLKLLDQ